MKVAIIQNQIGVDGRSRVVAEIVKVLNDLNLSPTIFSFSKFKDLTIFQREYFEKAPCFKHELLAPFFVYRGYSFQVLFSNMLAFRKLHRFDIIINSNSAPYFMPSNVLKIYYFHFPLEAEWAYNARYRSWKYKAYLWPLQITCHLLRPVLTNSILLANSDFTRQVVSEFYNVPQNEVEVVYPPAYNETEWAFTAEKPKDSVDVLSIGAFTPDKMQLEQIQIAEECPEWIFGIAGRIKSRTYYIACKKYIDKKKISNVKLFPNISRSELVTLLKNAKVFLHSKRYEHFGIATVEAIAAKCIPIVHNSGGQREVVPLEELRYDTKEEAIAKIKWALLLSEKEKQVIVDVLNKQAKEKFSNEAFRAAFKGVLARCGL